MRTLPFALLSLLVFASSPVLPAASTAEPPPEATPYKAKKAAPSLGKKRPPKLTQRATVKARKRMQARSSAPITAKTPPSMPAPAPAQASPDKPAAPTPPPQRLEVAYFGAGCFWCVEGLYQVVPGVLQVVSGYAGGTVDRPTYKQVLSGTTGHAEVVQVTYDAARVSYEELLENFWEVHDPTQVDRQGTDVGPQYRSIILTRNAAEQAAAEKSKAAAQRGYRQPIATQIAPLDKFWIAEDFHQDYFARHPGAPYCKLIIQPKLEKFQKALRK